MFFSKGFRLWNHGAGKSCLSAESPIEVDCGTCLCVPLTSCQWCPGAYSPSRPSRPSPAPAPAPSTADHPPSLAAQPAMWTAAPVCAFLKPPADGVLVPRHPPQPCQPQAQPQCPHPVPSKADHLRCRDARRATRTAAHVHLAALRL